MKKLKIIQNYISNILIFGMLAVVFIVTYASSTLKVFSSSDKDAIYQGNIAKNNVSLMINVYWGTEYIEPMLEVLKQKNVKTTFFVGGSWAINNIDLLKNIYNQGHEIGNHGYFHKDHKLISLEKNQQEIYLNHQVVKENLGFDMTLFAPPSGSYNSITLSVAYDLGYKTIMWTKDTIDWRDKNSTIVYNRAVSKPKNGDLILMHPTQHTLEALPNIIDFYQNNSFKLTTVSENIA